MHSQFSQLRFALVGPHKCLMSPNKGVLRNFRNWKPKLWHFGMARPTHRQHAQLICKQLTHLPISVENNLPYAFPQICETSLPSCFHFFFLCQLYTYQLPGHVVQIANNLEVLNSAPRPPLFPFLNWLSASCFISPWPKVDSSLFKNKFNF